MMTKEQKVEYDEIICDIENKFKQLEKKFGTTFIHALSTELNDKQRITSFGVNGKGADIAILFTDIIEENREFRAIMSFAVMNDINKQ